MVSQATHSASWVRNYTTSGKTAFFLSVVTVRCSCRFTAVPTTYFYEQTMLYCTTAVLMKRKEKKKLGKRRDEPAKLVHDGSRSSSIISLEGREVTPTRTALQGNTYSSSICQARARTHHRRSLSFRPRLVDTVMFHRYVLLIWVQRER